MRKYLITGLLIWVPLAITLLIMDTIIGWLVTGVLARNFVGRRLLLWWEGLLGRIPIVRSIYASVKQVSDTMLSPKGNAFRKVVLVEFPQPGQWTLAFIVGEPSAPVAAVLKTDLVTVYVPTAPNPTSGYVLMMPSDRVREVDISVDDALKFHVSLGVVTPGAPTARPAALTSGAPGSAGQHAS
jgi:uncharacterized membrane protein